MRTLDDLRLSFEQHADLAGDTRGLVQAARVGAVRIRRRRRIVRACVSAAVVTVLAVAVPVVVTRNLAEPPAPAIPATPSPAPPSVRRLGQVTLDLDIASGYVVRSLGTLSNRQEMTAVPAAKARNQSDWDPAIEVVVLEPGVYNAGALPGTVPVTVAGHDAWFQSRLPLGRLSNWSADDARGPAIGWQERSGVQVVVFARPESDFQRAELLRVAEGLRIGRPRDVTVPLRLGWIPAGMEITAVTVRPQNGDTIVSLRRGNDHAELWAVPKRRTPAGSFSGPEFSSLTVAGRPAVFQREAKYTKLIIPEFGTCGLFIETATARESTKADFIHVLETLTVADCEDRKTWTRPAR